MKLLRVSFLLVGCLFWFPDSYMCAAVGENAMRSDTLLDKKDTIEVSTSTEESSLSPYERNKQRYERLWSYLAPNHYKVQFAGSVGMFSIGPGWHYGRHHDQWETDLTFGYLPKFSSKRAKMTMTIKQSYLPWHLSLSSRLVCTPLTCGVFFNTIFGSDFWANQPSKYPKKYYGFSTKIRANLFVGQRITCIIPPEKRRHNKSIGLYYELSTCDLYLASYFTNADIKLWDILSLALGLRVELF